MTERAPQLLFDDGSRVIQQSTTMTATDGRSSSTVHIPAAKSARASTVSISKYYEIDRIALEIVQIVNNQQTLNRTDDNNTKNNWFARVALQFPDELLCDAPEVCWAMEEALEKLVAASSTQSQQEQESHQPSLVFCLGDTTFGPCCPDEVAALHLNANVLVHYGHACLSHPALSLPVVYGFGVTDHWDTELCVGRILTQAKQEGVRRLLLLYQVRYHHAMEDLQVQLSERGDILLVAGQIPSQQPTQLEEETRLDVASKSCCEGAGNCESISNDSTSDKNVHSSFHENDNANDTPNTTTISNREPSSKSILLGGLEVAKGLDFSSFTVVFVGDQASSSNSNKTTAREGQRQYINTILWYLSTKSKPAGLWTYSPLTQTLHTNPTPPPGIQRQLNRRFYLIQKARDASIFGILIGTLSQKYFRSVVQTLRNVIEEAGRSSYTFAMGKVNPAKIANFAEIDCFIMVACAETSWLDEGEQREMHVPIITPLELHMALGEGGPEVNWGLDDYSLDYIDFLVKYPNHNSNNKSMLDDETANQQPQHTDGGDARGGSDQEASGSDEDEDEDAPYYSLITGKYECTRKGRAGATADVDLTALPGKGQLTTYKSEAAEFLKNREYKGLEANIGDTEVRAAVPGQQGIASLYNNDLNNRNEAAS